MLLLQCTLNKRSWCVNHFLKQLSDFIELCFIFFFIRTNRRMSARYNRNRPTSLIKFHETSKIAQEMTNDLMATSLFLSFSPFFVYFDMSLICIRNITSGNQQKKQFFFVHIVFWRNRLKRQQMMMTTRMESSNSKNALIRLLIFISFNVFLMTP